MEHPKILINSDMGEGLGLHAFGHDETLMSIVDAVNLACGFHAGDPHIMAETVALAARHDLRVGAHPGYPDLAGFGRRRMLITPQEAGDLVRYQVGALTAFLAKEGLELSHIKPHGALYGYLAGEEDAMREVAKVNRQYGVPFFGIAGTLHESVCEQEGVEFVPELYVDLNYDADGNLIIERRPKAADPNDVRDRVSRALSGEPILAVDGTEVEIEFASICVHSDTPNAPEIARTVREALDGARA